jgi:hypothetical protein
MIQHTKFEGWLECVYYHRVMSEITTQEAIDGVERDAPVHPKHRDPIGAAAYHTMGVHPRARLVPDTWIVYIEGNHTKGKLAEIIGVTRSENDANAMIMAANEWELAQGYTPSKLQMQPMYANMNYMVEGENGTILLEE